MFTLVSDLDDTIKISHTTSHFRTVLRGLFTYQAYTGMSELYQEWLPAGRKFLIISSSPRWIEGKVRTFLRRNSFPNADVWLRDWLGERAIRQYKAERLEAIRQQYPAPYIFVGDDSEWDPEVFAGFRARHPDEVLAVYIRRMKGRPLPAGTRPFHTAFEIACAEIADGRLKVPQAARIGKALVDQGNPDLIVPHFAHLGPDMEFPGHPQLEMIHNVLSERLSGMWRERELKRKA